MFEFAQDGSFTSDLNSGRGVDPAGFAVDAAGNLYLVVGSNHLEQYSSSGNDIGDVTDDQTGSQITGFAVDPSTSPNDIYADDGGSLIRHYTGTSLSTCVRQAPCLAAEHVRLRASERLRRGARDRPGHRHGVRRGTRVGNDIVVHRCVHARRVTGQATSVGTTRRR